MTLVSAFGRTTNLHVKKPSSLAAYMVQFVGRNSEFESSGSALKPLFRFIEWIPMNVGNKWP